jgi:hypothetical protein
MRFTAIAIVAALSLSAPQLPPVPPLPADQWPRAETAEPFARDLMAHIPPATLDAILAEQRDLLPAVFRNFGTALLSKDATLRAAAADYATALVRAHAQRIPRAFTTEDVQLLVTFQVIDPLRYGEDEQFRAAVDAILPRSLPATLPLALRRADVAELNRAAPLPFDTYEALASAAGLLARRSGGRFVAFAAAKPRVQSTGLDRIEASIFSLNSRDATPEQARGFLAAVRRAAPQRRLIVLGDAEMHKALGAEIEGLHIDFIDSFSRPFTLWPRDPFFVARGAGGALVFVNRPNLQRGREEDANMVRALIDGLPKSLDERWKPRWTTGTTAFHNGQVLLTPDAVWISMHSVELRAREILGLDHVPVETFGTTEGVAKYFAAVQRAAGELAQLYGRPVRFVHDMTPSPALVKALGGGAGFDLDSIVTLLPRKDGKIDALVGDVSAGLRLAKNADWSEFAKIFGTEPFSFIDNQGLQAFLDRCAKDLATRGMHVQRLPLLLVSQESAPFLVTWNNVRLEEGRAEGFASGLPAGDRMARDVFAQSGYQLTLFPPLPRSIILNGGYRCASNEVRER